MTNQNNKLDEILDSLYCDAWFAGRVAEREQSGIRSVTPKFDEAKQAIQALYAPKPVENGELRTICGFNAIVFRKHISNRIAELNQEKNGE